MSAGLPAILEALANPVRSQVLLTLEDNSAKYSDLLQACDLDPYSESGKLGYHLHQLVSLGLVTRDESGYALTDRGRKASKLMARVKEASREILETPQDEQKGLKKAKVSVREAGWADIQGIISLWRTCFPGDDRPDYFMAELAAGPEGIRQEALLHRGSGLGRLIFVAETEHGGEIVACCILDQISLAHMKAEYLRRDPAGIPGELRSPQTEEEEEFRQRYWEAQSRLIATLSLTNHLETKYGVTGTWLVGGEPIKLMFTRKSFAHEGYVTTDLDEIMEEILWFSKVSKRAEDAFLEEMKAMWFGGPPACYEILQLLTHPGLDGQEITNMILESVESRAASRGISFIVNDAEAGDMKTRELFRKGGFIEIHQPRFEYKHAGRRETCTLVKRLPSCET